MSIYWFLENHQNSNANTAKNGLNTRTKEKSTCARTLANVPPSVQCATKRLRTPAIWERTSNLTRPSKPTSVPFARKRLRSNRLWPFTWRRTATWELTCAPNAVKRSNTITIWKFTCVYTPARNRTIVDCVLTRLYPLRCCQLICSLILMKKGE